MVVVLLIYYSAVCPIYVGHKPMLPPNLPLAAVRDAIVITDRAKRDWVFDNYCENQIFPGGYPSKTQLFVVSLPVIDYDTRKDTTTTGQDKTIVEILPPRLG